MDTADKKKADIDIKDVIVLIRSHYDKDEETFKKAARRIASQFEVNGDSQLAHYIWGLVGDEPTWVPMDEDAVEINIGKGGKER